MHVDRITALHVLLSFGTIAIKSKNIPRDSDAIHNVVDPRFNKDGHYTSSNHSNSPHSLWSILSSGVSYIITWQSGGLLKFIFSPWLLE